jgi:membrane protein implicated in regulation of membrane protease activity
MSEAAAFLLANPFWVWLAIGAVVLAAEVHTATGWLLWPAACAGLVALITLVRPLGLPIEALVFALTTVVSTVISRRFIKPAPKSSDINEPSTRVVGHHGLAVSAFVNGEGRVFVDGKEWAAEADPEAQPAVQQRIEVTAVNGARLRVRLA